MTHWMMHVERESHWENIRERRWRASLVFRSRAGIFRFKAVMILVTLSGLLHRCQFDFFGLRGGCNTYGLITTASYTAHIFSKTN